MTSAIQMLIIIVCTFINVWSLIKTPLSIRKRLEWWKLCGRSDMLDELIRGGYLKNEEWGRAEHLRVLDKIVKDKP